MRNTRMNQKGTEYDLQDLKDVLVNQESPDPYLVALTKMIAKFDLNTTKFYMEKGYDIEVKYVVTFGDKWDRVWVKETNSKRAFCFIDSNTGLVYKPNDWKTCAKGERADIFIEESYEKADPHGGWLYRIQTMTGRGANQFRDQKIS